MQRRRERDEDDQLHATEHQDAGEDAERDVAERLVALAGDAVSDVAPEGDEHQVDQSEGHLHVGVAEDDGRGDVAVGVEDAFLHVAQHVPADDVHQVGELQDADRHGGGQHHDQQLGQNRVRLVPRARLSLDALPVGFHKVGEALEDALRAQLASVEDEQLLDLVAVVLVRTDGVDVVGRQALQRDLVVVQAGVFCRVDFDQLELAVLCRGAGELLEHELPKLVGADHEVVQGDGCTCRERLQVDRGRLGLQRLPVSHQVGLHQVEVEALVAHVQLAVRGQLPQGDGALAEQSGFADVDEQQVVPLGLEDVLHPFVGQLAADLHDVEADAVDSEDHVVRQGCQIHDLLVREGCQFADAAVSGAEVVTTVATRVVVHSVAPFSVIKPGWAKQDVNWSYYLVVSSGASQSGMTVEVCCWLAPGDDM